MNGICRIEQESDGMEGSNGPDGLCRIKQELVGVQDRKGWHGWYMQDRTGWYLPITNNHVRSTRSISKSLYLFQSAYSRGRKRNVRVSVEKECASVMAECFVRMRYNKESVCKAVPFPFLLFLFPGIQAYIELTHMLVFNQLLSKFGMELN